MPSMFKKPSKDKNFFQNYSDHVDALELQFVRKYERLVESRSVEEAFNYIADEALARLNIFESLKDGHDYADEFVGATAIPAMGMIASLAFLGKSIYEASQAVLMKVGLMKNDRQDHLSQAGFDLAVSGMAFALSIASFLKSTISLVTRPIATLINGFAKQEGDRFYREDAIDKAMERATSMFGGVF